MGVFFLVLDMSKKFLRALITASTKPSLCCSLFDEISSKQCQKLSSVSLSFNCIFCRFEICKKLGQGTYGKVQLGINKETGQQVRIKNNDVIVIYI